MRFLWGASGQYGILSQIGLALCMLGLEVRFEGSNLNVGFQAGLGENLVSVFLYGFEIFGV